MKSISWALELGSNSALTTSASHLPVMLAMIEPNQSSEPTFSSVTPPAGQETRPIVSQQKGQ